MLPPAWRPRSPLPPSGDHSLPPQLAPALLPATPHASLHITPLQPPARPPPLPISSPCGRTHVAIHTRHGAPLCPSPPTCATSADAENERQPTHPCTRPAGLHPRTVPIADSPCCRPPPLQRACPCTPRSLVLFSPQAAPPRRSLTRPFTRILAPRFSGCPRGARCPTGDPSPLHPYPLRTNARSAALSSARFESKTLCSTAPLSR